MTDRNWTAEAVCARIDPEVFFPDVGGSNRRAKAMCATCSVIAPCLEWALSNNERFGVFGGLSERERRALPGVVAA